MDAAPEPTVLNCATKIFGIASEYHVHPVINGSQQPVPLKTDLWCYHDGHPFDTPPIVDEQVYCSWSCRKAYLKEHPSAHSTHMLQTLPMKAHKQSGISGGICAAPPKCALNRFGGPMTIEEFRKVAITGECLVVPVPSYRITETALVEIRRPQTQQETFQSIFDSNTQSMSGTAKGKESDTTGPNLFYQLDEMVRQDRREQAKTGMNSLLTKRR